MTRLLFLFADAAAGIAASGALAASPASAPPPTAVPVARSGAAAPTQRPKPPVLASAPKTMSALRGKKPRRPIANLGPLATIGWANAQARDWPTPAAYVNSALYYDFEPGRLYTIHTSPQFLTTIALRPGEKLIAKAAGDTVRWVLGETVSGAGDTVQVTIFIKPTRPDLHTNIVLTTDQRTYLIDAVSTASGAYTSVLSWNYPQDVTRSAAAEAELRAQERGSSVAGDITLDRLDFRYRIEPIRSRPPRWTPIRVFDDGVKTYVEFPGDLATFEAPPLFLIGPKGQAELVNYRPRGAYYVVDRLIEVAELRLGEARQTVVRISRTGARR